MENRNNCYKLTFDSCIRKYLDHPRTSIQDQDVLPIVENCTSTGVTFVWKQINLELSACGVPSKTHPNVPGIKKITPYKVINRWAFNAPIIRYNIYERTPSARMIKTSTIAGLHHRSDTYFYYLLLEF